MIYRYASSNIPISYVLYIYIMKKKYDILSNMYYMYLYMDNIRIVHMR